MRERKKDVPWAMVKSRDWWRPPSRGVGEDRKSGVLAEEGVRRDRACDGRADHIEKM